MFIFIIVILSLFIVTSLDEDKITKKVIDEIEEEGSAEVIVKLIDEEIVVMEVSEVGLDYLKDNPYVEKVEFDFPISAFLEDTVGILNATKTYSLDVEGLNLTGSYQSVCVLDSGVNYSHADFGGCIGAGCGVVDGYDFVNDDGDPMDDFGHGTHVAGIVGANGSINGIAYQANIIAMKVLDESGDGVTSSLISAINWCVANKSVYNISVITMSLGTSTLYEEFCDASFSSLGSSINAAYAANISIIAATGNVGNYTAVASPACIQNVTAVTSSTKTDGLSSFSNRNKLVDLIAPGTFINSTKMSGGYLVDSGTSMAAPHVAGAFALIYQLLNLTSQIQTPKQVEAKFNQTGASIYDSSSDLNFSRINIYGVVLEYDNVNPNVTLISPSNNSLNVSENQTFNCNVSDWQLSNVTFYLYNSSDDLINQSVFNVSGENNQTNITVNNLETGTYYWNCYGRDLKNNFGFASSNFSLIISSVIESLSSPTNNNYTNIASNNFNCTSRSFVGYSMSNVSFYLYNSTELIYNETKNVSGFNNVSSFNYSFGYEDEYNWNCLGVNNISESDFDSNFSVVYDLSVPVVSLSSPNDGSTYTSSSQSISFDYNATDDLNMTCKLFIDGVVANSSNVLNESDSSFVNSYIPGTYTWSVNCSDLAMNQGNTSSRSFIVYTPSSSSSGGGSSSGGSSGGGGVISYDTYQINEDRSFSGNLKVSDRVNFNIINEEHIIRVAKVGEDEIVVVISSSVLTVSVKVGESKKIDLDLDGYFDLIIKLNSIFEKRANVKISLVKIPTIEDESDENVEDTNLTGESDITGAIAGDKSDKSYIYLLLELVVILMVVFLGYQLVGRWFGGRGKKSEKKK